MTPEDEPPAPRLPLVLLLLAIAAGGALDLLLDAPSDWWSAHALYEVALIIAALGTATWLWVGRQRARQSARTLRLALTERQAERDEWRASAEQALHGLARAIHQQLARWQLTPAEREVAVWILRGRTHREIAEATGRSDRTVRQHAATVYAKAGLAGRAELAAFFLADLPITPPDAEPPA